MRQVLVWLSLLVPLSCWATTKGLNQIVTPDVQPAGEVSLSYQQQDPTIGDPAELQLEVGLTHNAEIAIFQGLDPHQTVLGVEVGLVQKHPWLLSAGFTGWSSGGLGNSSPQPFVEGGWYSGRHKAMAGLARASDHTELILGYGYQLTDRLLLQTDYQSGPGNSVTAGFTYNFTPSLSLNPALYLSNDEPQRLHGYAVLTWTVKTFH
jgi:hypothetical protein